MSGYKGTKKGVLRTCSRFTPEEKRNATEVQRANMKSWGNIPITIPPMREGKGDGFDAMVFPRFGSIER
jgi:hypothetical protein